MFKLFRVWYYNTKYPFMKPLRNGYFKKINKFHRDHWSEAFTMKEIGPTEYSSEKTKYNTLDIFSINKGKKSLAYKIMLLDNINDFFSKIIPSTYTAFDVIPYGWKKAFGKQMCDEIKNAVIKDKGKKYLKNIHPIDIKEKNGYLDMDFNITTTRMLKVLYKYEYISQHTCIVCGDLAVGETPHEYWECPYCEEHKPKDSTYFIYYGIKYPENNDFIKGPTWYEYEGNINNLPEEDYKAAQENYKEYNNLINNI